MNKNDEIIVDIAKQHGYNELAQDILNTVRTKLANNFLDNTLDDMGKKAMLAPDAAKQNIDNINAAQEQIGTNSQPVAKPDTTKTTLKGGAKPSGNGGFGTE